MPVLVPNLDDRTFDQLLEEAKRRIPVHTPEWTNFEIDSDPGITLVQLFAFLTESLIYRANRIPERDRLKFLQLLGVPLQKAAAAQGVVVIHNPTGTSITLEPGAVVTAGNVGFLTRDSVTALPVEVQVFYKRKVPPGPRFDALKDTYESIVTALAAADGKPAQAVSPALSFYETQPMEQPALGKPNPVLDLQQDTLDQALYLALLAPANQPVGPLRKLLVGKTLSIGVAPAQDALVPLLSPIRPGNRKTVSAGLVFELPDVVRSPQQDRYQRLQPTRLPDVLNEVGVVQLTLPADEAALQTWTFSTPLTEGTLDYPPRLEDERLKSRIITWLRVRLPRATEETSALIPPARLRWVGINATRVEQAIPIANEPLGTGTGEPDQSITLANVPVIESTLRLVTQEPGGTTTTWRRTDDLFAARETDAVFVLDPESGTIRFGDGLRGLRPQREHRIFASYQFGGGPQGNVNVGVIKSASDVALTGCQLENPIPTWGGDQGESVAEGEKNIPLFLRHRDRLVTALDFEAVTKRTPGVDIGRVEVLPLFDPRQPAQDTPGAVTVLVIPLHDRVQPLWPIPERQFLRTVCDYLDERRLVTTEIHVRGPEYVPVFISVGVQVREGYFHDTVLQAVSQRLREYLSSLPPGGIEQEGWELNRRLLSKDLEAMVTRVPGVEFVTDTLLLKVGNNLTELRGLQLPQLVGLSVVEGPPVPLSVLTEGTTGPANSREVIPIPVSKAKC